MHLLRRATTTSRSSTTNIHCVKRSQIYHKISWCHGVMFRSALTRAPRKTETEQEDEEEEIHEEEHKTHKYRVRARPVPFDLRMPDIIADAESAPIHFTLPPGTSVNEQELNQLYKDLIKISDFNSNINCWNNMFSLLASYSSSTDLAHKVVGGFHNFKPGMNERTYSELLRVYLIFYSKDRAFDFVTSSMENGFFKFDQKVLHNLLKLMVEEDQRENTNFTNSISFFDIMRKMFLIPRVESYNIVIGLHVKLSNIQAATELLDELLAIDVVKPSIETFSPIVNELFRRGPTMENIHTLIRILKQIRRSLKQSSREIHNSICEFFYSNEEKFLDALRNSTDDQDLCFLQTALSYSTLNVSMIPLVDKVHEILVAKGLAETTLDSLHARLRTRVREGKIEEALQIFPQITSPSVETIDLLIYGFKRVGNKVKASQLEEVRKQYQSPDNY